MEDVAVIGLDIAKSVFQLHGVDAAGATVLQKRLTRSRLLPFFEKLPPCIVGIEACSTSHFWARELNELGHEVKLMPAQYVKPYVKRQKNDAADAEAIAEAVTRPSMRFVATKTPAQQSAMMLHKVRFMLNRQLTMITNAFRAHMAEFGLIAPVGRKGVDRLLAIVDDETDERVPAEARQCLQMLVAQLRLIKSQILENDREVLAQARSTEMGKRLMEVPGIGPLVASALVACVPDPTVFRCGRNMAAWIGLVRARTHREARPDWAPSPRRAIATCDRCCSQERWRLSAERCRGPSGHGSFGCSNGASQRSLPWHWRTRMQGSHGPS